ncbi:MAG: class I SAM-dependent methyltransferase [Gemmatimonadales bacterium]|nr:class I SAM-dependent methyltransferase [Gemmatimonadales bacterium]MDQ3222753.1 class I SAM-dependent methyltransferase [Gemmatimonadota bacterium]
MIEPLHPSYRVTSCPLCGTDESQIVVESAAQMSATGNRFTFVRCRQCELIYLSPRVVESEIGRYYEAGYLPHRGAAAWGKYAPLAAEGQRRTDRARVRWARRVSPLGSSSAVLDVGCGRPTFLAALGGTGARAVGLDSSDAGWSDDRERWAAAGLELHQSRVSEGLPAGPFDLITMWHSLEHDYQPLDTLRRLRGVVREGGALLVEVPNYQSLTRRLHGPQWAGYHTPRHTAVYTPATLAALLKRAGWRVEVQHSYGTLDPYVLWWLGRQERAGRSLAGNQEAAFLPFMVGKVLTLPVAALQRWLSLGVQLAVARA